MTRDRKAILVASGLALLLGLSAACVKRDSSSPTDATCAYSVSSTAQDAATAGGSLSVIITRTSGSCTWAATSNASWITFPGSVSASDTATLTYAAAANPGATSRSGTITIQWTGGSAQVTVSQPGTATATCTYTVSPTSQSAPAAGGAFTVAVTTTGSGCAWTASADVSWITMTAGSPGSTSGTVAYTVAPSAEGAARTGRITVQWAGGSAQVLVQQSGASCNYTLSGTAQGVSSVGGNFKFTVTRTTPDACAWSISSAFPSPWITLTSATSGDDTREVTYVVAPNTDGVGRTGRLVVTWAGGSTIYEIVQEAGAPAPAFNASIVLYDPGRQALPSTECQIRSSATAATTCTLTGTTNLPTAVVTYDFLVQYTYDTAKVIRQTSSSPTLSFQETCGGVASSDAGTAAPLSVQLTMTDTVGNTATVQSGAAGQPALQLKFFTCGR